ncbi:MAG: transposase, partial [Pseudomonadota bacterium]
MSIPDARVARFRDDLALQFGLPEEIVLDNRPEGTGKAMVDRSERPRVRLRLIEPGRPVLTAFVESFDGTVRDERLDPHRFRSHRHAREEIDRWRHRSNAERPRSALGHYPQRRSRPKPPRQRLSALAVSTLS